MDYLRSWIVMSNVKDSKSVKIENKNDGKKNVKSNTKKKINTSTKKGSNKTDKKSINKPMNVEEISLEESDSFYHVSLLAQAVCVIGILAISVLAIFENSFTVPIEVLVGVTLLIMAYNNVKLFKRKGFTMIYIVFGVISLIIGLLGYFGVTL